MLGAPRAGAGAASCVLAVGCPHLLVINPLTVSWPNLAVFQFLQKFIPLRGGFVEGKASAALREAAPKLASQGTGARQGAMLRWWIPRGLQTQRPARPGAILEPERFAPLWLGAARRRASY